MMNKIYYDHINKCNLQIEEIIKNHLILNQIDPSTVNLLDLKIISWKGCSYVYYKDKFIVSIAKTENKFNGNILSCEWMVQSKNPLPDSIFQSLVNNVPKKKIYIAGKIGYLPENVWKSNFAVARQEAFDLGYDVVCPTLLTHDHDKSWLSHMREDLKAMMDCDAVYAQRNWKDSKGATIEVELAKSLGLEIIYQ